jgi:DNA-binding transcriptional LysR family regulator
LPRNHRYPDIDFVLHDRPQQWVLESIRQGDVDFGIVIDPGQASDLACESVLSEPFCCSAVTTIRLPRCRKWLAVLQGANLVLQDYASGSRPLIDAALVNQGVKATIVQEIGHPATLFPWWKPALASACCPPWRCPCRREATGRQAITPVVERKLMLVRRKNRSLSGAAQAIWEVVRIQAQRLTEARIRDPLFNASED